MANEEREAREIEFGWFLPTAGDGKYVGVEPERPATLDYLTEVAQAAENAGFEFVLIPTGGPCLDAWVVGSAVMSWTKTLRPLVAVRPGLTAPVLSARMGAALDQLSGGRAMINVVTGSSVQDLEELGDPLARSHDERYERADEYLEVMKRTWANGDKPQASEFAAAADNGRNPHNGGESATALSEPFRGKHYSFERTSSSPRTVQKPHPPFYLGGSSEAAKKVAVRHADTFLMWGEPHAWIEEQIAEIESLRRAYEEETGRPRELRYGMRAQVLVRDTEEEAWAAAREIISQVSPEAIERAEKEFAATDATNQRRQNELREQSKAEQFVVGPNLWTGLSVVRSGGAILIVGTADQVSQRLIEYAELGVSTFILSGYPHLEEAEIFGREALPLFREKWAHMQKDAGR
ncbi:LLM class flavin-dependent oxidoreductase [Saccharibacillus alkalitolerans]|uniref:LLM class flavin-dependent oxidoreductase n=1 Tax=Saccharibacillus alkalitolerans TaxID=2705290 RepID=A0ABX0FC94_9BACL|nr:LLM class flavin-dependent oxidoreductase [Saccharibacillus alkalitolerans]NGZ77908.1 LLM class flavin-dependent oxidoreductase [Saccharibacillus alkalitolerans]